MTVRELLEKADPHVEMEFYDEDDYYLTSGSAIYLLKYREDIVQREWARFNLEIERMNGYPVLVIKLMAAEEKNCD